MDVVSKTAVVFDGAVGVEDADAPVTVPLLTTTPSSTTVPGPAPRLR